LTRGGVLAWGAVPNTERIEEESGRDAVTRIRKGITTLEKFGVDPALLRRNMLITPACGCAGLSVEMTEKVYGVLSELDSESVEEMLKG